MAGALQRQRQIRGGEGVADHAGLRRAGGDGDLAGGGDAGPDEGRRGEDEGILRTERIGARRTEAKQEQAGQPDAADDVAKSSGASGSLHPAARPPRGRPAAVARGRRRCSRVTRGHRVSRRPRSPRGAPTFRRQRQGPIAGELLVDDEAVAIEWPAGVGIEHASGKGRAAPHEIGGSSASVAPVAATERAPTSRRGTPKSSTVERGGVQGDGVMGSGEREEGSGIASGSAAPASDARLMIEQTAKLAADGETGCRVVEQPPSP